MVDQPFKTWAFPGSFFPTSRTMPDRIRDVFNVKEFGATGNGSTDDRAAIVATMQAAANNSGGIVFFPAGSYYVASKIIPPADTTLGLGWGLMLVGSGGNTGSGGTQIWTDQRDYVLYCGHGTTSGANQIVNPIRGIVDISFKNTYGSIEADYIAAATPTSTEPKSTTGYIDGTPGTAGTEGHGCLYLGQVFRARFIHCNIQFGTGIGIYVAMGYGMEFLNCDIIGGFPHGSTNPAAFVDMDKKCIGIWLRMGSFKGSRTEGCGTAIVVSDGPVQIENIDIENSGNGIVCGSRPINFWDSENFVVSPAEAQARFQMSHIRSMGCEKIVNIGYWIKKSGVGACSFTNCHMSGGGLGAKACDYGLKIEDGVTNMLFQSFWLEGYMQQAGVDLRGATSCTFRNVAPYPSGPAVPWMLRTDWTGIIGSAYGNIFELCDQTDGGVLFSQLPPGATGRFYSHDLVCTDSTLPRFSAGVSNVGKTIVGTGNPATGNRVGAKWDGTSWTIA